MNNNPQTKLSSSNSIVNSFFMFANIVNPKRDWKILMILFVVFIVGSIGFDAYLYRQIVNGDMYITVNKEDIVIENLKSSDLQKILDNFETKKIKATTLKLENLVDPSL